jgi:hypothetical protein
MSISINNNYIEKYASDFTNKISSEHFGQKKYMTGQDIIHLTPSVQVNFFIIKSLFEAWQSELEKLKSNPYFDYRDNAVHEALKDFMNVLSRSIKIERQYFDPLLNSAVTNSILLSIDPVGYYAEEFHKVPETQLNTYLKENKKYYKWHTTLILNLIDRAGIAQSQEAFLKALENNYEQQKTILQDADTLLQSLNQVLTLDMSQLMVEDIQQLKETPPPHHPQVPVEQEEEKQEVSAEQINFEEPVAQEKKQDPIISELEEVTLSVTRSSSFSVAALGSKAIDPLEAWSRFESEQYSIMKGSIHSLTDSIGINQRFMFTKELFSGNPDLLKHALKSLDECESFVEAIELINERYVAELGWDKTNEAVIELLQLVFRKFDQKG